MSGRNWPKDGGGQCVGCVAVIAFATRFVSLVEMFLVAQIPGLNEIGNAPKIEQPVFQRRAGKRQALRGFELLYRLGDLRGGILDDCAYQG